MNSICVEKKKVFLLGQALLLVKALSYSARYKNYSNCCKWNPIL